MADVTDDLDLGEQQPVPKREFYRRKTVQVAQGEKPLTVLNQAIPQQWKDYQAPADMELEVEFKFREA